MLIVGLQSEPVALDLFSATLREVDIKTTLAHVCDEDLAAAVRMLDETEFAHAAFGDLMASPRSSRAASCRSPRARPAASWSWT